MHVIQVHPVTTKNQFHCTKLYLKFLSYPLPKKVESPFLSMSSPALRDLWSRCERQHGERRGRRLFWVSLGGNELSLESSIAAAAPRTVMDRRRQARGSDEESNYKESDKDRQRRVLPVARARGRRRSWFQCACRVRLSYLRPSPFLLAISMTETLFAYAGEEGRGE